MTTVYIEIRGGNVVSVQSTDKIKYCIIDWDNYNVGEMLDYSKYESDRIAPEKEILKDFKKNENINNTRF